MIEIAIPGDGAFRLNYLVMDYNGPEGAAADAIQAAAIVAPSIQVALDLLLHPLRLVATLRS